MLQGHRFEGRFLFDGDVMRAYEVDTGERDLSLPAQCPEGQHPSR
jgi:hypothetical protein